VSAIVVDKQGTATLRPEPATMVHDDGSATLSPQDLVSVTGALRCAGECAMQHLLMPAVAGRWHRLARTLGDRRG
jgi:hypothetical protein